MPYIPTTITHMSSGVQLNLSGSRELYSYRFNVSGGSETPAGVKSVTAGTGIIVDNTGPPTCSIRGSGVNAITAGAGGGLQVTTAATADPEGTLTTIAVSGTPTATSGTQIYTWGDFTPPSGTYRIVNNGTPLVLLELKTPTANNYIEVEYAFIPTSATPASQCRIRTTGGILDANIFVATSPTAQVPPANCYGYQRFFGDAAEAGLLPNSTGVSTYAANTQFVSCSNATPTNTWYLILANANPNAAIAIDVASTTQVQASYYANNVVSS